MKKLLSILAAVGLTATAGASVVACGNKDPEAKPQIADLLKDKLELGKVKTKAEALTKAQTEVDKVDKLKGHVKLDDTVASQIKVTATDDTLSGEATFTYQLERTIDVDKSEASAIIGQEPVKRSIGNLTELTNPSAESKDEKIATANIVGENVEIRGVAGGTTTVIVKADNANEVTIKVRVYNQVEKVVTDTEANVLVNGTHKVEISNYEELTGIKVETNKPNKVSGKVVAGGIELTGQEVDIEGTLFLTVSAANAKQTAKIQLTVHPQAGEIIVDKTEIITLSLKNPEPVTVKIENFKELEGIMINSLKEKVAHVELYPNPDGTFEITLGISPKVKDETKISIATSYTDPLNLQVKIVE